MQFCCTIENKVRIVKFYPSGPFFFFSFFAIKEIWLQKPMYLKRIRKYSKVFYDRFSAINITSYRSPYIRSTNQSSDILRSQRNFGPSPTLFFWHCLVASNCMWKMGKIFVAYSEYLSFTRRVVLKIIYFVKIIFVDFIATVFS